MTATAALTSAELDDLSQSFESSHPIDVIRWAAERFGTGLVATVSFEDPVLAHLMATSAPEFEVVMIDTQYLFAETHWYANELSRQLDLRLRVEHPLPSVLPDNLWQSDTAACCNARKVEPLQRILSSKTAWVTGVRRVDGPTRANAPIVSWDETRGVVTINAWRRYPTTT